MPRPSGLGRLDWRREQVSCGRKAVHVETWLAGGGGPSPDSGQLSPCSQLGCMCGGVLIFHDDTHPMIFVSGVIYAVL